MHTTQQAMTGQLLFPSTDQDKETSDGDVMEVPPAGDTSGSEKGLLWMQPEVLETLLRDHSTGRGIIWASDDYAHLGEGYGFHDEITTRRITGVHSNLIKPRVQKSKDVQVGRKRDKAEIFTPAWIVNAQLNLIDTAWFGREGVFNTQGAAHTWIPTEGKVAFPVGKTWQEYVRDTRLEITCGEGPYLVSRYDATTGEAIPLERRVGIIDRKLRVVGENTSTTGDWLQWAQEALMSTWGYEWQGDSLLLARESVLTSFIDYYRAKFASNPQKRSLKYAAYIISWNVFQMDGLKGVVPSSCGEKPSGHRNLLGEDELCPCEGCRTGDNKHHNGTYCFIRNWRAKSTKGEGRGKKIRFVDINTI